MNKLYSQNFKYFLYSYIMMDPYFNNATWVYENVLNIETWDNTTKDAIYYDSMYGMSTTRNLTIWVEAALGSNGD